MNPKLYHRKEVRATCLSLPETSEVVTWGHPTFRAGKRSFAVLEEYDGHLTLAVKVGLARQEALLAAPEWPQINTDKHR